MLVTPLLILVNAVTLKVAVPPMEPAKFTGWVVIKLPMEEMETAVLLVVPPALTMATKKFVASAVCRLATVKLAVVAPLTVAPDGRVPLERGMMLTALYAAAGLVVVVVYH